MEKSIIREIYYGKRGRDEKVKLTEEFKSLSEKIRRVDDKLLPKLSGETLELYKKIDDLTTEKNAEEVTSNFVEGFKIGLLIGIECSKEENDF